MPAASDAADAALPRTWRPFGTRIAGTVAGGGLVAVCLGVAIAFGPEIRAEFTIFQRLTLIVLGGLLFAVWFALVRCRITATEGGLTIINGYRRADYAWAQVVAIRLPQGAPWARLDLSDGTTSPVLGIQGSDGPRARAHIAEVRALIDAHHGDVPDH